MPRRPRVDRPGRLHHVMNRGIARRTVFESRRDKRVFLALLARAVRERRIELHAFVLLSTHFHLLVRSLDGNLSETLRRVQNVYVRWFNRTRRRDGPLFRGRFRSVPVDSAGHVRTLVRYIDDNAVEAGLAPVAAAYDFGSAVRHVAGLPRPRWLHRDLVDGPLLPLLAAGVPRAEAYARAYPSRLPADARRWVERRLLHPHRTPIALEDLATAAGSRVFAWMRRKARLADGTRPGLPLVRAESVARLVNEHRARAPGGWIHAGGQRPIALWDVALAGLLRSLAGETLVAIGRRLGTGRDGARRLHLEHRDALEHDVGYRGVVVELARRLLRGADDDRDASGNASCHEVGAPLS
ncbi:MAG: transposase [Planctomycetes bacterium]|nr:transposase [Planctomycetota bacterium]